MTARAPDLNAPDSTGHSGEVTNYKLKDLETTGLFILGIELRRFDDGSIEMNQESYSRTGVEQVRGSARCGRKDFPTPLPENYAQILEDNSAPLD